MLIAEQEVRQLIMYTETQAGSEATNHVHRDPGRK